jgi:hypothetical protein
MLIKEELGLVLALQSVWVDMAQKGLVHPLRVAP